MASEDRDYVESLAPGPERDVVVASLTRYRRPEVLRVRDPIPDVSLRRPEGPELMHAADLCRGRPLLLVFGSFT